MNQNSCEQHSRVFASSRSFVLLFVFTLALISFPFQHAAWSQVCYDRVTNLSCCGHATPTPATTTCSGVPCPPAIMADPPTNIVYPGGFHTNPAAWTAAPALTCSYIIATCGWGTTPCTYGTKVTNSPCPDFLPTTWLPYCPSAP